MHKKFYCKTCRTVTLFISHVQYLNKWICQNCRYATSNPIEKKPRKQMPRKEVEFEVIIKKKQSMDEFWNEMESKSKANAYQNLNQSGGI